MPPPTQNSPKLDMSLQEYQQILRRQLLSGLKNRRVSSWEAAWSVSFTLGKGCLHVRSGVKLPDEEVLCKARWRTPRGWCDVEGYVILLPSGLILLRQGSMPQLQNTNNMTLQLVSKLSYLIRKLELIEMLPNLDAQLVCQLTQPSRHGGPISLLFTDYDRSLGKRGDDLIEHQILSGR